MGFMRPPLSNSDAEAMASAAIPGSTRVLSSPDLLPLLFVPLRSLSDLATVALVCKVWKGAVKSGSTNVPKLRDAAPNCYCARRRRRLLQPLVAQIKNSESEGGYPAKEAFRPAWQDAMLALSLEPDNAEAQAQLAKLNRLAESFSNPDASAAASAAATAATSTDSATDISSSIGSTSATTTDTAAAAAPMKEHHGLPHDVIVVGAGASGVGLGVMLNKAFGIPPERVLVVERGDAVGESFRRWPKEMRFISPSFNQQGWTKSFDLNSVFHGTSPAFSLHAEHPTGEQYATYLSTLAEVRKKERKKEAIQL